MSILSKWKTKAPQKNKTNNLLKIKRILNTKIQLKWGQFLRLVCQVGRIAPLPLRQLRHCLRDLFEKQGIPVSWTMQKVQQRLVARFDAARFFIFLILWTLQSHFTLWLSARILRCVFEDVWMPQHICTLPGLDQGWTKLYQVLRASKK